MTKPAIEDDRTTLNRSDGVHYRSGNKQVLSGAIHQQDCYWSLVLLLLVQAIESDRPRLPVHTCSNQNLSNTAEPNLCYPDQYAKNMWSYNILQCISDSRSAVPVVVAVTFIVQHAATPIHDHQLT